MTEPNTDVIQGTLDMLIVNPRSLLTSLKRLERAGWLESEWRQTENSRRAKYYSLTRAGERKQEMDTGLWKRRSAAMGRLRSTGCWPSLGAWLRRRIRTLSL